MFLTKNIESYIFVLFANTVSCLSDWDFSVAIKNISAHSVCNYIFLFCSAFQLLGKFAKTQTSSITQTFVLKLYIFLKDGEF